VDRQDDGEPHETQKQRRPELAVVRQPDVSGRPERRHVGFGQRDRAVTQPIETTVDDTS